MPSLFLSYSAVMTLQMHRFIQCMGAMGGCEAPWVI